jgi:N-methylhydantoinase B
MEYSLLTERRRHPPPGAAGGQAGKRGRNLIARPGGAFEELPGKAGGLLRSGDFLRIETPGGGGYGTPED